MMSNEQLESSTIFPLGKKLKLILSAMLIYKWSLLIQLL